MLYKSKKDKKVIVEEGYEIEKKSLFKLIDELISEKKEIYILNKDGKDIREIKFNEKCVFILSDHKGFPLKEMKRLKSLGETVSVGKNVYFASQVITIINNELDRQEI